ncbi:Neuritin-like protein, partial [Eudyptula minor novaehollandiae]
RSWDDFHACASEVLSSCPEEAAAIWESLRQESRKIQFQGNLQELCSAQGRLA